MICSFQLWLPIYYRPPGPGSRILFLTSTMGTSAAITQHPEIVERIRANLRAQAEPPPPDGLVANEQALAGLTIAVQKLTTADLYAEVNLTASRLVLCDSLPAAFKFADVATDPAIDVILGAKPVLEFMVANVRKDWRLRHSTRDTPAFGSGTVRRRDDEGQLPAPLVHQQPALQIG